MLPLRVRCSGVLLGCLGVVVCLGLTSNVWAQAKKPKLNQYKRMHQDALANILQGKADQAKLDLNAILEKLPDDAESHYMLAVAHAMSGRARGGGGCGETRRSKPDCLSAAS